MTLEQRMGIYLSECALHASILNEGLADANTWLPLSPESEIGKEMLRVLDQVAYRFGKLQDSMGEKVLPLILEMAEDPIPLNATFSEKLNRLERIGADYVPKNLSKELKQAFDIANEANFTEQELELQHRKKDWVYMQKSSLELAKSQGIEQGKKEVVIKSFKAGLDRQRIRKITGLNEEQIDGMINHDFQGDK